MRTKLFIALALVIAIMPLAGCSGSSVEAARAAVPQFLPAPHPPPRPPVRVPRPPRPPVHIPGESIEVLKQQRVRHLEDRYAQVDELMAYACLAKGLWDVAKAETVEDAVRQAFLNAGGTTTFLPQVVELVYDLDGQSSIDRIGQLAVFTYCNARL
jgi:hypothetical protein